MRMKSQRIKRKRWKKNTKSPIQLQTTENPDVGNSLMSQSLAVVLPKASLSEEIASIPDVSTIKLANSVQISPEFVKEKPQIKPLAICSAPKENLSQKAASIEPATSPKGSSSKHLEDKEKPPLDGKIIETTTSSKKLTPVSNIVESQIIPQKSGRMKERLLDVSKKLENKPKSHQITPKLSTVKRVKIHFIPVGSAPQMKKRRFQISGKEQFSTLQGKLRKMLQLTSSQLFLYINESFVPSPNDLIEDLDDLFSSRGSKGEQELKVNYSLQEAWG